jgi:hypothetical protein
MEIKTKINGRNCLFVAKTPYIHQRPLVGIDPDNNKSGVARVVAGKLERLENAHLFDLGPLLLDLTAGGGLVVLEYIDNSKPTFAKKGNTKVQEAISRSVGRAQDAARHIQQLLDRLGIEYVLVEPLKGPEKRLAKGDKQFFADLTGWSGRTNEDKRDAAMLALYGLPGQFQICSSRHVYTGRICPSCHREEQRRERIRARRLMKKRASELAGGR